MCSVTSVGMDDLIEQIAPGSQKPPETFIKPAEPVQRPLHDWVRIRVPGLKAGDSNFGVYPGLLVQGSTL